MTGPERPADATQQRHGLQDAVEALGSGAETLRSLGWDAEANDVDSIIDRVAGSRAAGTGGTRPNVLRRRGDYCLVMYEADVFQLRDARGLQYLATLLGHPGREIHVLDLVGSDQSVDASSIPTLDLAARRAYTDHLRHLEGEIAEAERSADLETVDRMREERAVVARHLAAGTGLGGRDRVSGTASERARQAATKALKSALGRISTESPALGRHLAATIRTGTYCRYEPDPRIPIGWRF